MPRGASGTQVPNADPLVCAYTLLASVPVLFFGFLYADKSLGACLALTFFAGQKFKNKKIKCGQLGNISIYSSLMVSRSLVSLVLIG
jgi:hypothetical protein